MSLHEGQTDAAFTPKRLFLGSFPLAPLICAAIDFAYFGLTIQFFGFLCAALFAAMLIGTKRQTQTRTVITEVSLFFASATMVFAIHDWGLVASLSLMVAVSFGYGILSHVKARVLALMNGTIIAASPLYAPVPNLIEYVLFLLCFVNLTIFGEWSQSVVATKTQQLDAQFQDLRSAFDRLHQSRQQLTAARGDLAHTREERQKSITLLNEKDQRMQLLQDELSVMQQLALAYIHHATTPIFIRDKIGQLIQLNSAAKALFEHIGLATELGQPFDIHAADQSKMRIDAHGETGDQVPIQVFFDDKDPQYYQLSETLAEISLGRSITITTLHDVTDVVTANLALETALAEVDTANLALRNTKEEAVQLNGVLHRQPVAALVWRADTKAFVYANEAFSEFAAAYFCDPEETPAHFEHPASAVSSKFSKTISQSIRQLQTEVAAAFAKSDGQSVTLSLDDHKDRHFSASCHIVDLRGDMGNLVLLNIFDITASVNLQKRQAELTTLFESQSVPAVVWAMGEPDRLAYVNHAFFKLQRGIILLKDIHDLPGRTVEEIFTPSEHGRIKRAMDEFRGILKTKPYGSMFLPEQPHHHGHRYQVNYSVVSLNEEENPFIVFNYIDITKIEQARRKLERQLNHDDLTGILSRRGIKQALADKDPEQTQALYLIDLDHFKSVNDTFGHEAGDRLLRALGKTLDGIAADTEIIGRLGGEEFLILRDFEGWEDCQTYAQQLLDAIAKNQVPTERGPVSRTASIGVALLDGIGGLSDALAVADVALEDSKTGGRNQVTMATPAYLKSSEVKGSFVTEHDIRQALLDDEMYYVVQPIMDTHRNFITGFEALIRWKRSDGTMVSPEVFGAKLVEVTKNKPFSDISWKMRAGLLQDLAYFDDRYISFNHRVEELSAKGAAEDLIQRFESIRDNPNRVFVIELSERSLTERVAMHDVLHNLDLLREHGIQIALDDFGVEASNLNRLTEFPIDIIKIDKSLVQQIETGPKTREVLRSTAIMAMKLGIRTIVEGVETDQQARIVHHMRAVLQQGFLHAVPMRPEQIYENLLDIGADIRSAHERPQADVIKHASPEFARAIRRR